MGQGAYVFGCAGTQLTQDEGAFFTEADPWGFVLFARNVGDPDQLRRLTGDLRAAVGRDAPVLIDQEGGRVQRMRAPHWREWMPPMDHVQRSGGHAARSMALRYQLIGHELQAVGIDCCCAPVADIATARTHAVLANRCYGHDVGTVATVGQAVADGMRVAGVLPVVKHMPGHGRAAIDSHKSLPVVDADAGTLGETDFATFRALAGLPMAMTAHIVYSDLDELPATQSSHMVGIMRNDIGFKGVLMTDDISMQALQGTPAERGQLALKAGCDLVLHCNGDAAEMAAIAATCGEMGAGARKRADKALAMRDTSRVDVAATEAELAALMWGQVYV